MVLVDTHSNALGWLLNEELGEVADVKCAVLVSGDGLLHSRTDGIGQDDAEKLAALTASLRAASNAMNKHVGGRGVRQHLVEFNGCFALTTAAAENTMLSVITTGTDADVGLITHHMVRLAARLGHAMNVKDRQRNAGMGSPA
ncbi:roadblock/LC7 domain-containing protein [Streptomyces sp. MN6]